MNLLSTEEREQLAKNMGINVWNLREMNPEYSMPFDIVCIAGGNPEATAMLQALYSRDPNSVLKHLKDVAKNGPEKFIEKWYCGYNHASIGNCGSIIFCFENVSMLAAKAVQDWPLYNGQEASTRYLDMSKQAVINPVPGDDIAATIITRLHTLYVETLATLKTTFKELYPKEAEEKNATYENTINAKCFDIARSLLPAGATTFLSWMTDLRNADDHLKILLHHPLLEIRQIAESTYDLIRRIYPSSFSHQRTDDEIRYHKRVADEFSFVNITESMGSGDATDEFVTGKTTFFFSFKDKFDSNGIMQQMANFLIQRPKKENIPHQLERYGYAIFRFPLDFGSFRDIQRHRSGSYLMPLLTTRYGFHPWYLDQLPETLLEKVTQELDDIKKLVDELPCSEADKQYLIPMGYQVICEFTFTYPYAVYVAELRSQQTVHPTLRKIAQEMGTCIEHSVPGVPYYWDMSETKSFNLKRGTQTIAEKKA